MGSLLAAVVSYLNVKSKGGEWLVRIEDIDPPREQAGAREAILNSLEAHGLFSDRPIVLQSKRYAYYEHALHQLKTKQRLYRCHCSRKALAGQTIYPGTCRKKTDITPPYALRFLTLAETDAYDDAFQGKQQSNPKRDVGDVILVRKDHLYAYQLAVVVDDIEQGVTEVIRGIDLIDSTWWQRDLYRALGHQPPQYGHFAVLHAKNSDQKLSKQNLAPPINDNAAIENLVTIFRLLNLNVDKSTPALMLESAISQWSVKTIFGEKVLSAEMIV